MERCMVVNQVQGIILTLLCLSDIFAHVIKLYGHCIKGHFVQHKVWMGNRDKINCNVFTQFLCSDIATIL